MESQTKAPAVGYVRVSTEEQAREGVSVPAQEERIRAYCVAHEIELSEILVDAGVSAKTLDRPAIQEVLARVRSGDAGTVIVYKLDRLTRSLRDLYALVDDELNPREVDLISMQEQIDTRTPAGRAMLGLMGVFAQMERELIAERTREAMSYLKDQGKYLGPPPLGFTCTEPGKPFEMVPHELETVARILELREAGATFRSIAAVLDVDGHETKRGGKWRASTVRAVWEHRERYSSILQSIDAAAAT